MQAPKWIFDAQTLSYVAGNSKYIYIYLYSYMYIKKGKIIYRTVSSQRHLEKSKNKSFFLKTDLLEQLHTQRPYAPHPLRKPRCYSSTSAGVMLETTGIGVRAARQKLLSASLAHGHAWSMVESGVLVNEGFPDKHASPRLSKTFLLVTPTPSRNLDPCTYLSSLKYRPRWTSQTNGLLALK